MNKDESRSITLPAPMSPVDVASIKNQSGSTSVFALVNPSTGKFEAHGLIVRDHIAHANEEEAV